jgi:transposase-like protein
VIDEQVLRYMEEEFGRDPFLSAEEMAEKVSEKYPDKGKLTGGGIRQAACRMNGYQVVSRLRRLIEKGKVHYKEEYVIGRLMGMVKELVQEKEAQAEGSREGERMKQELEVLKEVSGQQPKVSEFKEVSGSKKIKQRFEGYVKEKLEGDKGREEVLAVDWMVMMVILLNVGGISLERLSDWLGKSKATLYRWTQGVALIDGPWREQLGRHHQSGIVHVDEKWIWIKDRWYYLFVAVDGVSGFVLYWDLLLGVGESCCYLFLWELRSRGFKVKVCVTDGLAGYDKALKEIFPECHHQRCLFHVLQNVKEWLREQVKDKEERKRLLSQVAFLFRTKDKRTVRRRFEKWAQRSQKRGHQELVEKLEGLLPFLIGAVGSGVIPTTNNAIERVFRAFNRFAYVKYGFGNVESARRQIGLFMIDYTLRRLELNKKKHPQEYEQEPVGQSVLFEMWRHPSLESLMGDLKEAYEPWLVEEIA